MAKRYCTASFILLITVCCVGCASSRPTRIRLAATTELPDRAAVIFFVDGMDQKRLDLMLGAGELPNLAKHFVDGGVQVDSAIASFPAITYPNSVSLITGCFPGHHGILGNVWFDRSTLEVKDYIHADTYRTVNEHFDQTTLYEILDDHFTVNVQCHTRRGVSETLDNVVATGIDWYSHNFSAVDDRVGYCIKDVAALANRKGRWPTVTMYYFPGVDEIGHRYGLNSRRYRDSLRTVDRSIGRVCDAIKASELGERTYFVLVTDHNLVNTPPLKIFHLKKWLEQAAGLKVQQGRLKAKSYDQRLRQLVHTDAVLTADAGRRAVVHLRGRGGWISPAPDEELQFLLPRLILHPAIDLAACRDGLGRIKVLSKKGLAVIERKVEGSVPLYQLTCQRDDPLGYLDSPDLRDFADGNWHDSRAWLFATAKTAYPDFVPQIVELFDSTNTGDMVLFASAGWGFDANSKSGHGSCLCEDLRVPLYFAGPDLPKGGRIDCARLVDIMPTVLEFLGESHRLQHHQPIDGVSIARELKEAKPANDEQTPAAATDTSRVLSHPGD